MEKRVFITSCQSRILTCLLFVSLISSASYLPAQESSPSESGLKYYLQLRNEEFLQAMIPKERFLLGLVQGVHEEMKARRLEGADLSDLGILEAIPPEQVFIEAYEKELQRVVALMDEIERLEREAKRQSDFQIIKALSRLKNRVRELIEKGRYTSSTDPMNEEEASPEIQFVGDDAAIRDKDTSRDDADEEPVQIDNLYEQWKFNRILNYKVKLTEYEFFRTRLLRTATPDQEFRMFKSDLQRALVTYSAGDFPVSRMQLQDVLETYSHYETLDDVLYYAGESSYGCNFFDEALEVYNRLVKDYPDSPFCARALVKLVYIYYIYGEFDRLSGIYQQILIRKAQLDIDTFGTVTYLVAFSQFKAGQYNEALEFLAHMAPEATYFFPSLYLSAACYSNVGNDELAISLYKRLILEDFKRGGDPILAQIKNNALLKMGLIYYERGDHAKATEFFDAVTQDNPHYDLSVIGKAWSAYRSGKPGEALQNVDWVLQNSVISSYVYEARVLAANAKDLLGHSEEAIEDLKYVLQTGTQADEFGRYPSTGRPEQPRDVFQQEQEIRQREMLTEIEEIRQFLENSASWSESTNTPGESNYEFSTVMGSLQNKIEMLDLLEEQARENENASALDEIRMLRSDLIDTLDDYWERVSKISPDSGEDPLLRRMGMSEYLKYVFRSLLTQNLREKQQTLKNIEESKALLDEARRQDQFDLSLRMEIAYEEFQDYYGKLNQHEVWLKENFPQAFEAELDQWTTFSGYGISNINFSRIKEYDRQIAQISQTIDALDFVFKAKRKDLENRIQGLLSDVAKIEEQMLKEINNREQKEKERFFKTEYFNRQRQETVVGGLKEKPEPEKKGPEKKEQE